MFLLAQMSNLILKIYALSLWNYPSDYENANVCPIEIFGSVKLIEESTVSIFIIPNLKINPFNLFSTGSVNISFRRTCSIAIHQESF